jgi:ATP-dependent DNA ligase
VAEDGVNQGQEFVIGGYTAGGATFDAMVFGYYNGEKLMYAGRTRNGFTPQLRAELLRKFKGLEIVECPFANLPEKKPGRWGAGLTASKMEGCRWLKPLLVGQFEFVEWTEDGHLRHSRFMGLRDDKKPKDEAGMSSDARRDAIEWSFRLTATSGLRNSSQYRLPAWLLSFRPVDGIGTSKE